MTYQFWNWFRAEGAKNLSDYNKANGTEMRLLQEKGLRNKEKENLWYVVFNIVKLLKLLYCNLYINIMICYNCYYYLVKVHLIEF